MHVIFLALGVLVASLSVAPASAQPGEFEGCSLPGVSRPVRCGRVDVREDRRNKGGRVISLNVAIVEAAAPKRPDPVVFLAGGPGQGAVAVAGTVMSELASIAPDRDIILIDQRGTGGSNPLTCTGGFHLLTASRRAELERCKTALEARAELEHYGTAESVEDVVEVIRALGHMQVNVVASSYGTRLALRIMRRDPLLVRSAVLRAIAPDGFNILLDGGRHSLAALNRLLADCKADTTCDSSFPDLAHDLRTVRERLKAAPSASMTLDLFDRTVYALMLAAPMRQLIPFLVHSAATRGFDVMAGIAAQVEAVYSSVSIGAYLSVVCREDAARLTPANLRELSTAFGATAHIVAAACSAWPHSRDAAPAGKPLATPTLVVSGEIDPAMPPKVGEAALRQLTRGKHVVLPATAHGPMFPGCATDIARSFIDTAGKATLDVTCVSTLSLPPFKTQ